MADEAADAVASTPAYTNPDGSYTNAGEVVEVGCTSWPWVWRGSCQIITIDTVL